MYNAIVNPFYYTRRSGVPVPNPAGIVPFDMHGFHYLELRMYLESNAELEDFLSFCNALMSALFFPR